MQAGSRLDLDRQQVLIAHERKQVEEALQGVGGFVEGRAGEIVRHVHHATAATEGMKALGLSLPADQTELAVLLGSQRLHLAPSMEAQITFAVAASATRRGALPISRLSGPTGGHGVAER